MVGGGVASLKKSATLGLRWLAVRSHVGVYVATSKRLGIGGVVTGGSDVTSCSVEEVLGGEDSVGGGSRGGASSHASRKLRMSSPGLS